MAKKKNPNQRWHAGIPDIVRRLVSESEGGLTDTELAKKLGVTRQTIHVWKKKYPEFAEVLAESKGLIDFRVEESLYKRAIGYEYKETEITYENGVETRRVVRIKYAHPDANACRLWLQNRLPDKWRDKQVIEHTGAITTWLDLYAVADRAQPNTE